MNAASKAIFLLLAACITLASGEASAVTQGTLGGTSSGSVDISITKPARANITSLQDLSQPTWSIGSGDITLTSDVCVYSTRPMGGYTVKASGSGASGAFTLANGGLNLPYSVNWNDGGVGALSNSGTSLTATVTSGGLVKAATDSSTCNGTTPGPTARLIVAVSDASMTSASAGTYSGTLTLLVTPN